MSLSLATVFSIVPPLLLIEGFFSGSEIALLSADKLELRQSKQKFPPTKLAIELSNHPERVLSTTLLMTSVCVIGISAVIALYFVGRQLPHSDLLAVFFTSPLVV